MAKVVVTLNDQIQQEVALLKSRLTIGRRPNNDLVLDHLTVSGQHGAIDSAPNSAFILDLGSTNGTLVNGQPITKHLLQNDDVIEIGKYKLKFLIDPVSAFTNNVTKVVPPENKKIEVAIEAKVKVLNGNNAGRELTLSKPITRLGSPGILVVTITREAQHFNIAYVEGKAFPKVNDVVMDAKPLRLKHGDVIDLSGTRMEFLTNNE
jgi:pSer/pThr/pTyr-binding forkhead associated (FHA) protein